MRKNPILILIEPVKLLPKFSIILYISSGKKLILFLLSNLK